MARGRKTITSRVARTPEDAWQLVMAELRSLSETIIEQKPTKITRAQKTRQAVRSKTFNLIRTELDQVEKSFKGDIDAWRAFRVVSRGVEFVEAITRWK